MKRRTWISLGMVLLLVVALTGVYENRPQLESTASSSVAALPQTGYKMPPVSLTEYPSGKVTLQQLRGKPIFINFWASWCTYCKLEMPDIVAAQKKYGKRVVFLSINVTSQDSIGAAVSFMKKYGVSWPVALDKTGETANRYHVVAFPASFFVNRQGVIVSATLGPLSQQTLTTELEKISQ